VLIVRELTIRQNYNRKRFICIPGSPYNPVGIPNCFQLIDPLRHFPCSIGRFTGSDVQYVSLFTSTPGP